MKAWWESPGIASSETDLRLTLIELCVPKHMWEGIMRYVMQGIIPGSFLCSIFENDFVRAVACADYQNKHHLLTYAMLLIQLPEECWGSPAKCKAWHEVGGLIGEMRDYDNGK